ncbi:hypothetical protein FOH10_32970 [Nocardia otitidiscaviarum]|uniref:PRC-barrel domain containing protein n=1 Tax=Nocardia otitidiscaviarum TaxID=1823 RepID=A0A516NV83_9NOCA|nr:hypothetical protein [Nocardia otitidiscaviarum]MCP9622268.1 hypothetical protein [Nocardia otitidiscaviarum]QDP82819.1 hypothetical protein FOH10_32970 [Nocardia otitidiscaviarum]
MKTWSGRAAVDLESELLDRQIVDPDGNAVGKVDDIAFDRDESGALRVSGLIVGPAALRAHLPPWFRIPLGMALGAGDRRSRTRQVPLAAVRKVDSAVHITADAARQAASPAEKWLRDTVIRRIPGSDHAS